MDDWQDAAFNHRRIPHGRSKKGGKAAGRNGAGTFNPLQALGSYELSGNAIAALSAKEEDANAVFEIHELTETPGGMIGSLVIGKRLKAAVFLAGSRKLLSTIVSEAEAESGESEEASDAEDDDVEVRIEGDEEGDEEGEEEEEAEEPETELEAKDRKVNERALAFEKNSFRNPKFWLQWQGDAIRSNGEAAWQRDQGYVIFSGNDCKDFKGTLSCRALEWKDVAIQGRKTTSRARSAPLDWNGDGTTDSTEEK